MRDIPLMKLLLIHDEINPNQGTMDGATPLHFAALQAESTITKLLLEKQANVYATISHGIYASYTPVHLTVMNPEVEQVFNTLKFLFQAGANMHAKSQTGQKPEDLTSVPVIQQFLQSPGQHSKLIRRHS